MTAAPVLGALALTLACSGCEFTTCDAPAGRYAVEVAEVSGDCGPVAPFVLEVPLEADGTWLGCSVTNDLDGTACSASSRVECPDGLSYRFELADAPGGDLRGTMTLRDDWAGCWSEYRLDGEGF